MGTKVKACNVVHNLSGLLRNCPFGDLAGLGIDQRKPQMLSPLTQSAEDTHAIVRVVGVSTGILVDQVAFERVVHADREFAGRRAACDYSRGGPLRSWSSGRA